MIKTSVEKNRSELLDQVYEHLLMHLEVGLQVLHDVEAPGADLDVAYRNLRAACIWMLRALALNTDVEYYVDQLLEDTESNIIPVDAWPDDVQYLIDRFGKQYPRHKQEYWPYLQLLRLAGRQHVKAIDLMRLGALALDMMQLLIADEQLYPKTYIVTDADSRFMGHYHEKRVMRVDKLLAHADAKDPLPEHQLKEYLDTVSSSCPRCSNKADQYGYIEKGSFYACAMLCNVCGAYLFDMKELQLAGLRIFVPSN